MIPRRFEVPGLGMIWVFKSQTPRVLYGSNLGAALWGLSFGASHFAAVEAILVRSPALHRKLSLKFSTLYQKHPSLTCPECAVSQHGISSKMILYRNAVDPKTPCPHPIFREKRRASINPRKTINALPKPQILNPEF